MNDRKSAILLCITGSLFFAALLWLFGLEAGKLTLLFICYICIAGCSFLSGYLRRRKRILYLRSLMDSLDQKYLFTEVTGSPESELEKVYFQLMKTALKSMTDEVSEARRLNREYQEFVEQWIHEIKVPLTGIQLLCENNRSDTTRKIMTQTEAISLH
ncbi:MAG: sensor histidine kinase, partial [Lachnospiraceae bacterium]|nr:sensor histidine kinase [Lachnospiraceae bacterium]